MIFKNFKNKLQISLLAAMVATSFVPQAMALTAKEQAAVTRAAKIVAQNQPVSALSRNRLQRQQKYLSWFVKKHRGNVKLRRDAAQKLRLINVELRRRQTAPVRVYKKPLRAHKKPVRPVAGAGSRAPLIAALSDRRPSKALTNQQLKRRIDTIETLLKVRRLNKLQRRTLRNRQAKDIAVLNKRRVRRDHPVQTNFAVLQDQRPATRLKGMELRRRISGLRSALGQKTVPRNIRRQLSRKLNVDRTELRRRVAFRRAHKAGEKIPQRVRPQQVKASTQARNLLNDHRAPRALNKNQLNRRIRSTRNVLKRVPLTNVQRARLANMIKRDRAEKRRRLFAARDRRRAKLNNMRTRGELRIEINPNIVVVPGGRIDRRRDLAAAEADEGMIQRQLLRKNRRTYKRRYTRQEIVRHPDLTRHFAGIDVDTVNFGFNEYWIREEEVDELERMAVTIERILAARPYEVFQIEGHTDAVGSDNYNLGLSRQRALAVKQALNEFFVIPANALVVVGLGERYLKIPTPEAEQENRRVTIRRITPIVRR